MEVVAGQAEPVLYKAQPIHSRFGHSSISSIAGAGCFEDCLAGLTCSSSHQYPTSTAGAACRSPKISCHQLSS